jgi:hypothetical protein
MRSSTLPARVSQSRPLGKSPPRQGPPVLCYPQDVTPSPSVQVYYCLLKPLKSLVPRVGFELTAYRLRSGCSTAELPGRRDRLVFSLIECGRQAAWRGERRL